MKRKYREQQKFLEVRVIFMKIVSIVNVSRGPIVDLTYCHQDIDGQINHVSKIEIIVFFKAEEIIPFFGNQLKDLDEDIDEQ